MDLPRENLLTLKEAGEQLGGLKEQGVRRLIREGILVAVNIGKGKVPRYKVAPKDLAQCVANHKTVTSHFSPAP